VLVLVAAGRLAARGEASGASRRDRQCATKRMLPWQGISRSASTIHRATCKKNMTGIPKKSETDC
jgi:hypothetical protein